MADRDTVELVRLEQPERLFDVEAVLGRDTGSVFPSAAKHAALVDFAASTGDCCCHCALGVQTSEAPVPSRVRPEVRHRV